jgi:hypothetical protein
MGPRRARRTGVLFAVVATCGVAWACGLTSTGTGSLEPRADASSADVSSVDASSGHDTAAGPTDATSADANVADTIAEDAGRMDAAMDATREATSPPTFCTTVTPPPTF